MGSKVATSSPFPVYTHAFYGEVHPTTSVSLTLFWLEMNSWRRRSCALSAARAFSLGRRSFVFPPPPTLRRREGPLAHNPDILLSACGRRLTEIGNTNAARTCTRRKLHLGFFHRKHHDHGRPEPLPKLAEGVSVVSHISLLPLLCPAAIVL